MATTTSQYTATADDPRRKAFYDPRALEVFHSICQQEQIWRFDPFDVYAIHEEARDRFMALLQRATTPPGTQFGHIMLLRGVAGSGKTHLMRAFRGQVQGSRRGYCGYLQMTTKTDNYGRYVLRNLIDSLEQPYDEIEDPRSGLTRLSTRIVETPGVIEPDALEQLREDDSLAGWELAKVTMRLAERFISMPACDKLDLDLIRALCYLQRDDVLIRSRVLKYLRCEELNKFDEEYLPELVSRTDDSNPREMVEHLGQIMWQLEQQALVLMVDQLEGMTNFDGEAEKAAQRFRLAMQTLCEVTEHVPSSIIVIACLDDFYGAFQNALVQSVRDRIENNPPPTVLKATRTEEEIKTMIEYRLRELYRAAGVENDDPLFPFPPDFIQSLHGLTSREVLNECQRFRDGGPRLDHRGPGVDGSDQIEQAWNDFKVTFQGTVPTTDNDQAELLDWAIESVGCELPVGGSFHVDREARFLKVHGEGNSQLNGRLLAAICNKKPQGGWLGKQVTELEEKLDGDIPVIVRSTAFPVTPNAAISRQIGDLLSKGGRRAVVEDSHWRDMLALRQFESTQKDKTRYSAWRSESRPLASLKPLIDILGLDGLDFSVPPRNSSGQKPPSVERTQDEPNHAPTPRAPQADEPGGIVVGASSGVASTTVTLKPEELTQHAAFLGGSGSGKTTAALNVLEQLVIDGIPCILIDRKGDLCGYGSQQWRSGSMCPPELADRWRRLRERADVAVFTPGAAAGRDLAIPLTPPEMAELNSSEREAAAKVTASALAGMMGFKQSRQDQQLLAILIQSVQLIAEVRPGKAVTIDGLIELIANQDATLINRIGYLDTKLCKKLAEALQTLKLLRRDLLESTGEVLNVDRLFGCGSNAAPGKVKLNVISTKFLGDNNVIEFWVAQFLTAVDRWLNRHPSSALQGVLFLDEADMYLPAKSQPATKWPMENLLKRARSGGLGLLLATQSPGDLDYKCRENIRNWFLGRIQQDTALRKLRTVFDSRSDLISKLSSQHQGSFILVRDGQPVSLISQRSALRTEQLELADILEAARQSNRV